jgi:hypothetical protein
LIGMKSGKCSRCRTFDHLDPHPFSTVCLEPGWQPEMSGTLDASVIYENSGKNIKDTVTGLKCYRGSSLPPEWLD